MGSLWKIRGKTTSFILAAGATIVLILVWVGGGDVGMKALLLDVHQTTLTKLRVHLVDNRDNGNSTPMLLPLSLLAQLEAMNNYCPITDRSTNADATNATDGANEANNNAAAVAVTGDDVANATVPVPRDLRLAFVGDSLSRYQYLSLVHFLRTGRFPGSRERPRLTAPGDFRPRPEEQERAETPAERRCRHLEHYWNSTMQYMYPYETCDCFCPDDAVSPFTENRYYDDGTNSVAAIRKNGRIGTQVSWEASRVHDQPHRIERADGGGGEGSPPPSARHRGEAPSLDWVQVIDYLARIVPSPTVVVLNAGHWEHEFRNETYQDSIVQRLAKYGMTGIYKTTTALQSEYGPTGGGGNGRMVRMRDYEELFCSKLVCMDVRWTAYVPPDLYMDAHHFYEPIYKRMNLQLLGVLQKIGALDYAS